MTAKTSIRSRWGAAGAVLGALALLGSLLIAGPAQAASPQSLLALGDSISRGRATCGTSSDCPKNNWATGEAAAVSSIASRLRAADPSTSLTVANWAASGSLISGVSSRIGQAVAAGAKPDTVTLLVGGNDLCFPRNAAQSDGYTMTTASAFAASAKGIMRKIATAWPEATILVASVPDVAAEWSTVQSSPGAARWASVGLCRTTRGVGVDGTPLTGGAFTASVAAAAARTTAYNSALASACAAAIRCIWDGGALTRMPIPMSDISTADYFHPNVSGQARIAATVWTAWGLPLGGAPAPSASPSAVPSATATAAPTATATPTPTATATPTPTPTAAPAPAADTTAPSVRITAPASGTTAGASVTFVASAADDVATTRVSFWSGTTKLGDAAKSADGTWRLTVGTSGSPAGTYSVTARATDAAGNEGRSSAVSIRR